MIMNRLLDRFLPTPDVAERHQIVIHAPAEVAMTVAQDFEVQSLWLVRALFGLRAWMLGARAPRALKGGLVPAMLAIGWKILRRIPVDFSLPARRAVPGLPTWCFAGSQAMSSPFGPNPDG